MHSNQGEYREEEFNIEELNLIDSMIKESLEEDFEIDIPMDFADKVTEVVEKRKSIREALLKHSMMCLGLFVIFAFVVAFLFYFRTSEANVLLDFVLKFKYPIAFVLLIITAIQLADTFLLSRTKDQLGE
ncbi:hypothetical protein GCQ56_03125 [Marinifilum sp. N1E240]|uniref:hypothetical protein n=1 Tax=Marinifilum sp. N1E240 TaxID=2608082 RepID=UPI00128B0AEF|nr:hypothetical protein [Marinifilum sp. N1E240]MPQ45992.1 hypothetical protein [Marinifilum sp. N1E240]